MRKLVIKVILLFIFSANYANDGYKLWLQYQPLQHNAQQYKSYLQQVQLVGTSPTHDVIKKELELATAGFFEGKLDPKISSGSNKAKLWIGLDKDLPTTLKNQLQAKTEAIVGDGYHIRTQQGKVWLTAKTEVGLLYATFGLLRQIQTGQPLENLDILENPAIQRRLLNHWDNLNRTVERGYAGFSIWNWHRLPKHIDQQYIDYARANASIGINGTVLTNVNANALVITPEYLHKAAALAEAFRPYGIKVYLTARFNAPMILDGLKTADPLDPEVQAWWKKKAAEIYSIIPDFGGFVVKADSEGQPGPHNYGRTQADGANLLADAVKPFGGIIMWRAFVYNEKTPTDRAKQAYDEFKPIDGVFRDNVIVQVKNGPIDFQPREPFHPLFGAMPKTPLMMEFQITKEYLGQDTHLVYLASMYEEVLQTDTYAQGPGSTVSKIVSGKLDGHQLTAMAGVANIGSDRNWTAHHFAQADWFTYGNLAWNPDADISKLAEDWLKMTFSTDPKFVSTAKEMMLKSYGILVDYMTPLGLHHIMARSHHWGPGPWVTGGEREDWTATYYHRATEKGVGFDRTATGSNALGQYAPEIQKAWGDADKIDEDLLLWFHHVPWDHQMDSGRTLWDEMALRYQRGVDGARWLQKTWASLEGKVDEERFTHVASFLQIQVDEAVWWRDACLLYFQQFSKMPLPSGVEPPAETLDYYLKFHRNFVPGI